LEKNHHLSAGGKRKGDHILTSRPSKPKMQSLFLVTLTEVFQVLSNIRPALKKAHFRCHAGSLSSTEHLSLEEEVLPGNIQEVQ